MTYETAARDGRIALGRRYLDGVQCGAVRGKVISYSRRRTNKRADLIFYGVVILVVVCAFSATLLWRPSEVEGTTAAERTYDFACDVAYVNDGDTLRCRDGTRVRLHAIAAREKDGSCSPGHPCPSASAPTSMVALERQAGGRINCIQTGTSYNRVTAICDNEQGVEINCAMVESGAASVWDKFNRQRAICRS